MKGKTAVKPFAFFFNTKGQDERTGEMYHQPDSADLIQNLNVDAIGQWSSYNQGYTNFGSQWESGSRIDALRWHTDTSGNDYLLAAVNGKVKHINSSTGALTAEISTGFVAGDPIDFEPFKGNLYAASAGTAVQKWTNSGSMSAASGWPLVNGSETYDKPSVVEQYANRLAFANFNGATKYPTHLVLSDSLAPETFTIGVSDTNAVAVQVGPGDGQPIVALKNVPLPNTNSSVLAIFKSRSIWALEGDTPSLFTLYQVNPTIGALNNRCVVQVGADIIFMDTNNIYSLTTASTSGSIQPNTIGSDLVKTTLASLNQSASSKCWGIHLPARREVWFYIPTGSNTEPDTALIYYYSNQEDPNEQTTGRWSVRTGTKNTCGVLFNKTFITGSQDGYLRTWHAASQYNGTAFNWIYRYPFFNFDTQHQNKRILDIAAWFLVAASDTLTIKYEWRGGGNNTTKTLSIPISLTSGGALYGSIAPPAGTYGTSIYGDGFILQKVKFPMWGNGTQLRLTFSGSTGGTGPIFLGVSGIVEYMGYDRSYK